MDNKLTSYNNNNSSISKSREMRRIILHHLNMLENKEMPLEESEFVSEADTNKNTTRTRNRLNRLKTSKKSIENLVNQKMPGINEIVLEGIEYRAEKPKNKRQKVHPTNIFNKSYLNVINKDRPLEETEIILKANADRKIYSSKKISEMNMNEDAISKENHPDIDAPTNSKQSHCKRKMRMMKPKQKKKKLEPTKSISLDGFLRKNDIPPEHFIKNILSKINRNKTTVFDSLKNDAHIKCVIKRLLKKELIPCRLVEKNESKVAEDLPLARNSQIKNMLEMGDKTLNSEFVSC